MSASTPSEFATTTHASATNISTRITLQRLIISTYIPMIVGTLGVGMLTPVLPLYLKAEGVSLGAASVVLAGLGIGASLGGLPAGSALARFGERSTMIGAFILMTASTAVIGFTGAVAVLLGLRICFGVASGALRLSRQTFITRRVATEQRGRVMSLLGGSFRLGFFIGPLAGGFLVDLVGFRATFVIAAGTAAVGLIPAWFSDRADLPLLPDAVAAAQQSTSLLAGLKTHWRRLVIAGCVPLLVMVVREGRLVVLPLIADDLDLTATQVGAIVTVSTAADLALFPVAGWIMDRFGRLQAMLPASLLVAAGLIWLGVSDTAGSVIASGALIGVGNGLSSGAMLTLGSDLAPADAPGPFLAGMSVMQSAGRVLGPLLVGVVGQTVGLGAASISLAIVMMFAMAWLVLRVGESSQQHRLRSAALRN